MSGEGGKFVAMRSEWKPREFGNFLRSALSELRMRVQACTHCGSANGEVIETTERLFQALDVALQQAGPAAKFLPKRQGHSIL